MKIFLLNTSIMPNYGNYEYARIEENRVIAEMQHHGFESAIGHQGTADVINAILPYNLKVSVNRQAVYMKKDDVAIVFKLNKRAPEGTILSKEEVERIGFEWGLITRIS